jgi:hypothetical protein
MFHEDATIPRDTIGKLVNADRVRQCTHAAPYWVNRLIQSYGIDAKLLDRSNDGTAACLRKRAKNLKDVRYAALESTKSRLTS